MSDRRCNSCRFCDRLDFNGDRLDFNGDGRCRRNPPVLIDGLPYGGQPSVRTDKDWCGEWRGTLKREELPPPDIALVAHQLCVMQQVRAANAIEGEWMVKGAEWWARAVTEARQGSRFCREFRSVRNVGARSLDAICEAIEILDLGGES